MKHASCWNQTLQSQPQLICQHHWQSPVNSCHHSSVSKQAGVNQQQAEHLGGDFYSNGRRVCLIETGFAQQEKKITEETSPISQKEVFRLALFPLSQILNPFLQLDVNAFFHSHPFRPTLRPPTMHSWANKQSCAWGVRTYSSTEYMSGCSIWLLSPSPLSFTETCVNTHLS